MHFIVDLYSSANNYIMIYYYHIFALPAILSWVHLHIEWSAYIMHRILTSVKTAELGYLCALQALRRANANVTINNSLDIIGETESP